jgi:histidinol phosphatase-like PHP family hydrolase
MAKRCGAKLVINTDTHSPNDLVTMGTARSIARGAGLEEGEIEALFVNAAQIMEKGLHTAMKGQNG